MSSVKRVLFLAGRLGAGGVTTHMAVLASGLVTRGIEVAIASRGEQGQHAHGIEFFKALGAKHFEIPFPLSFAVGSALSALPAYRRCIRQFRPDLVHVHWRCTSLFALLSQKFVDIPFVSSMHISGIRKGLGHRLLSFWGSTAIAVSAETEAELTSVFGCAPDMICRVPYGLDTRHFRPPNGKERYTSRQRFGIGEDDTCVVSLVGSGVARKGHGVLIEAIARLRQEGIHCVALIAGDPSDGHEVERLADRCGLRGQIRHLGYCDTRDVMWASDVFVLPSLREGLPIVINEAMLCGVVHVRTPTAGARDQTIDGVNGFVIGFNDVSGLCERLRTLATRNELRLQMANNSVQFARGHFAKEQMIGRILDVYDRALMSKDTGRYVSDSDGLGRKAS